MWHFTYHLPVYVHHICFVLYMGFLSVAALHPTFNKTGPLFRWPHKKKSKGNHSNIHFASIAPQRCIFRYLNSGRDFLPIDINFNVKIKGYETVQFRSDLMTVYKKQQRHTKFLVDGTHSLGLD